MRVIIEDFRIGAWPKMEPEIIRLLEGMGLSETARDQVLEETKIVHDQLSELVKKGEVDLVITHLYGAMVGALARSYGAETPDWM